MPAHDLSGAPNSFEVTMTIHECLIQVALIAFPVAILALLNGRTT